MHLGFEGNKRLGNGDPKQISLHDLCKSPKYGWLMDGQAMANESTASLYYKSSAFAVLVDGSVSPWALQTERKWGKPVQS